MYIPPHHYRVRVTHTGTKSIKKLSDQSDVSEEAFEAITKKRLLRYDETYIISSDVPEVAPAHKGAKFVK